MRVAVAVLVLVLSTAALAATESKVVVHPAGAYRLEAPPGWRMASFRDEQGWAFQVLTDSPGREHTGFARGLWIAAVPIPTDEDLKPETLVALMKMVFAKDEPKLKLGTERRALTLGGLKAMAAPVSG